MPVVLLVHCDGSSGSTVFTDVSPSAHTLTATTCTVSTTSPKFGTGSADFTASSSTSQIATASVAAPDFNLGAGQFTVEAWVYFTSAPLSSNVYGVVTQWGLNPVGWFLGQVSGAAAFYYSTTGSDNPNVGAAFTPTLNTWYHLAADRDASNVLRVYVNGAVVASATVSATIYPSPRPCLIGNDSSGGRSFPGRIDEVRVTIGLAQYGGAFTPPTGPFGGTPNYVDFAGNIGSVSLYGKGLYGAKLYSQGGAFAPVFAATTFGFVADVGGNFAPVITFAADLTVIGFVDLAGNFAPQMALGASLGLDMVLQGDLPFTATFAASGLISGPLWLVSTPCPPPLWTPSDPCPSSLWTPTDLCDPVAWEDSETCNG